MVKVIVLFKIVILDFFGMIVDIFLKCFLIFFLRSKYWENFLIIMMYLIFFVLNVCKYLFIIFIILFIVFLKNLEKKLWFILSLFDL